MGYITKETTSEYVLDDETGKMKMVKQKINEKNLPPNIDILKIISQPTDLKSKYENMSDEDLEKEKQRLIKELKENKNDSRKSKSKSEM